MVTAEYILDDVTSPHGLVDDAKTGRLFVAGRNGRMATSRPYYDILQSPHLVEGYHQLNT